MEGGVLEVWYRYLYPFTDFVPDSDDRVQPEVLPIRYGKLGAENPQKRALRWWNSLKLRFETGEVYSTMPVSAIHSRRVRGWLARRMVHGSLEKSDIVAEEPISCTFSIVDYE
jgi:hypothetical protein